MIIQVPESKKIEKLLNVKDINEGFFSSPAAVKALSSGKRAATQGSIVINKIAEEKMLPNVERFLKYYDVQNYEIECTGKGIMVDVHDNLFLPNKKLSGFPGFKFRWVDGFCNFSGNKFTDFSLFPRRIGGTCIANFNYIKNFYAAPERIGGNLLATKQNVKTEYPLTKENYEKYLHGDLLENRVYVISKDEYGELTSINESTGSCTVLLDNGNIITVNTNDVDCLESSIKLLL